MNANRRERRLFVWVSLVAALAGFGPAAEEERAAPSVRVSLILDFPAGPAEGWFPEEYRLLFPDNGRPLVVLTASKELDYDNAFRQYWLDIDHRVWKPIEPQPSSFPADFDVAQDGLAHSYRVVGNVKERRITALQDWRFVGSRWDLLTEDLGELGIVPRATEFQNSAPEDSQVPLDFAKWRPLPAKGAVVLCGIQERQFFRDVAGYLHSEETTVIAALDLPARKATPAWVYPPSERTPYPYVSRYQVSPFRCTEHEAAVCWQYRWVSLQDRSQRVSEALVTFFGDNGWTRPVCVLQDRDQRFGFQAPHLIGIGEKLWVILKLSPPQATVHTILAMEVSVGGASEPVKLAEGVTTYAALNAQGSNEVGGVFDAGDGLVYAWLESGKPKSLRLKGAEGHPQACFVRGGVLCCLTADRASNLARLYTVDLPPKPQEGE